MPETIAITKAITNLNEAQEKFNIIQANDPQFFTEWLNYLPELTEVEKKSLDRLKNRYLYYAADGFILEATVNIYRYTIEMDYVGATNLAPGEDGYVFKFSREQAAEFCGRQEQECGVPTHIDP